MWTYAEELAWRREAQEFDNVNRQFKTNLDKFNELKVRHLLKRWSFEEYDPKFKLLHVNGVLADESYNVFKGFFPVIIDQLLFMMNRVLENNG